MTRSLLMLILAPGLASLWLYRLAYYYRDLRCWIAYGNEGAMPVPKPTERPLFSLEYNNTGRKVKAWVSAFIFCSILAFCFFKAADIANYDMHHVLFSLSEKQTYFVYYWAWKFDALCLIAFVGVIVVKILLTKRVSFFSNAVVLENLLLGKKTLSINDNVRSTKSARGDVWLYNQLSTRRLPVFNIQLMKIDSRQKELLDEFLSRIPERKETMMV